MLFLAMIMGLYLIVLIISVISRKIYILIYTNYTLGLIFPYPKLSSIIIFLVAVFSLLTFGVIRVIVKLKKNIR